MSTKTLRKRIALVAVSAMGFGLLSTGVAHATASASGGVAYTSGTTGGFTTVVAPTNGACSLNAYDGTNLTIGSARATSATASADLTDITMPVGSSIVFKAAANGDVVKASGTGTILQIFTDPLNGGAAPSTGTTGASGTSFTAGADADPFVVSANQVGTAYLKNYGTGTSALTTIKINVVAACTLGTFSAAASYVELQSVASQNFGGTGSGYSAANSNVDEVSGAINGKTLYLSTRLNNSYGQALPTGTFAVSATGGALVGLGLTNAAPTCGLTSSAASSGTGSYVNVAICQGTDNAPWSGTVTISYNGTDIVTKSATITGDIASIKVSSPAIGKTGGSTYRVFTSAAYDSAGNLVKSTPTVDSTLYNQYVTAIIPAATVNTDVVTTGNGITCGPKAGKADVSIKVVNAAGATITSNKWTAQCGGALDSFKASMDKTSYSPGDIATVTVTGLDAEGSLVYGAGAAASNDTAVTSSRYNLLSGTNAPVITGGDLDVVVAPTTTDYFSSGVKKYQFKVGATDGKYNLSVNLPDSGAAAVTIPYEVVVTSSGVTNAEVLAAIVKLIASINKQIAALQKALMKK